MRGFIVNTNFDGFTSFSNRGRDDINFWRPSGSASFEVLAPGQPLLCGLKAPHRALAGFGSFERYVPLPDRFTWETFGKKSGVPDGAVMSHRAARDRRSNAAHCQGAVSRPVQRVVTAIPGYARPLDG